MNKMKLVLATVFLLIFGIMAIPDKSSAESEDCYQLCEDLCGSPTASACQYTYCEGGTYLCYGDFQDPQKK